MAIGEARGGITPRLKSIAAEFAGAGMEVSVAEDVRPALWHKFLFIASLAGLSTLSRAAPYEMLQSPEARATLRAAMEEVYAVGIAHGVNMDPDIVERQYAFCLEIGPGQKPSMLLDLEQGKRLEIDALSGAVVRLGAEKRIPTPVHLSICAGLGVRG
jgi:2-dehydropantoate 2-reductase